MAINYSPVVSDKEKDPYKGFSENLYGNNWFVLSTNEGLSNFHGDSESPNPKYTSICGVLDEVPKLSFSTEISDGPQKTATEFLVKTFSISNDGGGSILGAVGAATGANLSKQVAGGYTAKMTANKEMKGEFDLSFTAWKRPTDIFDPQCTPSDQGEVINYLTQYATVDATGTMVSMLDQNIDQAMAGLASVVPIAKQAVEDAGKVMFGKDDGQSMGFLGTIDKACNALAAGGDQLLARGWSDRQRISLGKLKFNESLHRLDILRAGVLDSYLIVAITNWSYKLEQDAMGEKMTVKITCKVDQRMSYNRLVLYSETKDLPVE